MKEYLLIAALLIPFSANADKKVYGKWTLETRGSRVIAYTYALKVNQLRYKKVRPSLYIRCGSSSDIYINFYTFMSASSDYVRFTVNGDVYGTSEWDNSTDFEAMFFPVYNSDYEVTTERDDAIEAMRPGRGTVGVQAYPYGDYVINNKFSLSGFARVVKALDRKCSFLAE